ncbi:MAG: type II toxin-antitoxin system Phd/YefM family antitoxin [Acidobacteriota bacterium]
MPEVGAYEAKTHLGQLLEQVEKGERFVITRHGRPVAQLIPVSGRSRESIQKAIRDLKAFQSSHQLQGVTIREMIEEGRGC